MKQPYLFDNITPLSSSRAQFKLELKENHLYIVPDPSAINAIHRKVVEGQSEIITQPTPISSEDTFEIYAYYALDKEKIDMPHKYLFEISFHIPNDLKTLIGVP